MSMEEIQQVASEVGALLVERGETVAVAESSAGGLISAALLGVAGASAYFKGGAVVYNADAKQRLVGMTQEDLAVDRSSTAPHTALLAAAVRKRLDSVWAVAETGATGPTGNRYGDAAGHVALAVAGPVEQTQVIETGDNDRQRNMEAFALGALRLLLESVQSAQHSPGS
jgi:nicotinamide-nucleotide amidase